MDSNKRCVASMEKILKNLELDDSSGFFFPTPEQFYESAMPQAFSLSKPIMKYILENPSSPEVYQKFIKSCKLFFLKNPILVIKNLSYYNDEWKFCNSNECNRWICKQEHKRINLDNLHGKIWILERFCIEFYTFTSAMFASELLPKIYRYDVQDLWLSNQNLTYNELKFFSTGVKECHLISNIVKYDDSGELVSLEDIIKLFSGAKTVFMSSYDQPVTGVCKDYDDFIHACSTIEKIDLRQMPASFDVREFYQRLKSSKNRASITIYSLDHADHLNQVIHEILTTEVFEFVPPVISYFRNNTTKDERMRELQEKEAAKYR